MEVFQAPEIPEVPALTGLPVTVKGELSAARWCSAYWPTAWRGFAVASEPVLALAFGTDAEGVRWAKSCPSWGNAVALEVVHGPYGDRHQVMVGLGSVVWPPVRVSRSLDEIRDRAWGIRPADGEIQVPDFGWSTSLSLTGEGIEDPRAWPLGRIEGWTGRLLPLFRLAGASAIRIDLLVLPRRLLRVGRCKIWRLKPRHRDAVPEPLRHLLCFGRAGRWPPERSLNQRYSQTL